MWRRAGEANSESLQAGITLPSASIAHIHPLTTTKRKQKHKQPTKNHNKTTKHAGFMLSYYWLSDKCASSVLCTSVIFTLLTGGCSPTGGSSVGAGGREVNTGRAMESTDLMWTDWMFFQPRGMQLATPFMATQIFSTKCAAGNPIRPMGIEL